MAKAVEYIVLNTSCQKAKAVEYYALKLRFKPDCWRSVLTTPK